jgi:hypothetical protein
VLTTIKQEREGRRPLDLARSKEITVTAIKSIDDLVGVGDADIARISESIRSRLDKAQARSDMYASRLDAQMDDVLEKGRLDTQLAERKKKLGLHARAGGRRDRGREAARDRPMGRGAPALRPRCARHLRFAPGWGMTGRAPPARPAGAPTAAHRTGHGGHTQRHRGWLTAGITAAGRAGPGGRACQGRRGRSAHRGGLVC